VYNHKILAIIGRLVGETYKDMPSKEEYSSLEGIS